jgi:tRNA(Ile)-lysidine synthase TilS/MesJ
MQILFADRLDRQFQLEVEPGEHLRSVLPRNHVPFDAVIVRKDGQVIDDWFETFDPQFEYRIDMVRAYHLPDLLALNSLWDNTASATQGAEAPAESFYTKRHFAHAEEGNYNATHLTFTRADYVEWAEQLFVDGCISQKLVEHGETVLLAVSGGKDSLALGYFLSRTKSRLPPFELNAVHVTTFSKPAETAFAREMAEMFGHQLTLVNDEEVAAAYRLRVSPREALAAVRDQVDKSYQIAAVHSMMRSSIERVARSAGISKIAFGLMREDILTSIIKSMFVGFPFGGSYKKKQRDIEFIYPLWPIGKKELTLYLEALYPTSNRQGSPVTFERGSLARDAHYMIADTLETVLPGASFQIFAGHERLMEAYTSQPQFGLCQRCEMSFQVGPGALPSDSQLCQLCSTLIRIGVAAND